MKWPVSVAAIFHKHKNEVYRTRSFQRQVYLSFSDSFFWSFSQKKLRFGFFIKSRHFFGFPTLFP